MRLDRKSNRGPDPNAELDSHKLNVGHVATGFAFELALKALARSEGSTMVKKHESQKNYAVLRKETKAAIEKALRAEG